MKSALIVSANKKAYTLLEEILRNNSYLSIDLVENSSIASNILLKKEFDLVIINTPLKDQFGEELSIKIINSTLSSVILIVKEELFDEISKRTEDKGIFIISKPLNLRFFNQALKFVSSSRKKILNLEIDKLELKNKIEEIKFVDRAKYVLIQYLNMTESQAHRHIEKQAMDMRITKKEVSKNILKTYEINFNNS